jgi:LPPG:FO 2-phospho-L-lactate transferase
VKVVVLAGGTGGATLASGLYARSDVELTVIANTADDDEFWGLLICPDIDAVIYRLAGIFNAEAGYGVKDESFHVLEMLRSIGEAGWFNIGDKDLATHLIR